MKIKGDTGDKVTTIAEDPKLERGHPHLFRHLKDELKRAGKWPDSEEDGEE